VPGRSSATLDVRRSAVPTPYVIALFEAVIFTVAGAAATLSTAFLSPYRHLLRFAWRIWLWGSIGLFIANLALLAALVPLANFAVEPAHGNLAVAPRHSKLFDYVFMGLVLVGPMLFSSAGVILGCWYGWRIARRRTAQPSV
jgi:hypothetical protein